MVEITEKYLSDEKEEETERENSQKDNNIEIKMESTIKSKTTEIVENVTEIISNAPGWKSETASPSEENVKFLFF